MRGNRFDETERSMLMISPANQNDRVIEAPNHNLTFWNISSLSGKKANQHLMTSDQITLR